VESREVFTHLRLNIYPDGGVARLRYLLLYLFLVDIGSVSLVWVGARTSWLRELVEYYTENQRSTVQSFEEEKNWALPLPASECGPVWRLPYDASGGEPHSLAGGEVGGGAQFRRMDRHSGTLYSNPFTEIHVRVYGVSVSLYLWSVKVNFQNWRNTRWNPDDTGKC
jgi:hypothetical protein